MAVIIRNQLLSIPMYRIRVNTPHYLCDPHQCQPNANRCNGFPTTCKDNVQLSNTSDSDAPFYQFKSMQILTNHSPFTLRKHSVTLSRFYPKSISNLKLGRIAIKVKLLKDSSKPDERHGSAAPRRDSQLNQIVMKQCGHRPPVPPERGPNFTIR